MAITIRHAPGGAPGPPRRSPAAGLCGSLRSRPGEPNYERSTGRRPRGLDPRP